MKLYELRRDSLSAPFQASRGGDVPDVRCDVCKEEWGTGFPYACLTKDDLSTAFGKRQPKVITVLELKEAEAMLQKSGLVEGVLAPGGFTGPWRFLRKARENWVDTDVLWPDPAGVAFKPDLALALIDSGIRLKWREITLPIDKDRMVLRYHIEIPLVESVHAKTLTANKYHRCRGCGRVTPTDPFKKPTMEFWLDHNLCKNLPSIFAVNGFDDVIILAAPTAEAFLKLRPTGIKLIERVRVI